MLAVRKERKPREGGKAKIERRDGRKEKRERRKKEGRDRGREESKM